MSISGGAVRPALAGLVLGLAAAVPLGDAGGAPAQRQGFLQAVQERDPALRSESDPVPRATPGGGARGESTKRPGARAVAPDGAAVAGAVRIASDSGGMPKLQRVVLVNRHLATVREVYLSPSRDAQWGPDRLGSALLERGAETEIEMAGPCEADLRIVFPTGGAEERRDLNLCELQRIVLRPGWTAAERLDEGGGAGDDAAAVRPEGGPAPGRAIAPPGLRLHNAGAVPVVELYIDPAGARERGPDRLGATVLGIGEAMDYVPPDDDGCAADVTAVFRDGRELRREGVGLCEGEELELP